MESFAIYLFRSVIWLTGFALVYLLFLRNERFFLLKRIYLLTGILVSLICPLFTIHYQVEVAAPVIGTTGLFPAEISSVPATPSPAEAESFDYRKLLLFLYLAGVIVLVSRLLWHIFLIGRAIRKSTIKENGEARLVRVTGFRSSFSFFNYVFINPSTGDNEVKEIVNHELVHINQKHWLDLLLTEALRIFQWMNPFAWIYTGFIRVNHEYMADEGALQQTSDPAYYRAALINQIFRSPVISLSNSFNYSLNKKRFDMMKHIITSPYRKLKVFLVLPVVAGILYAFAAPEYNYVSQDNISDATFTIYESAPIMQKEVRGIVLNEEDKPLSLATIISMQSGTGTQTGSDGRFVLVNISKDSPLKISCIGYKDQIINPDFTSEMVIKMVKDPEYKRTVMTEDFIAKHEGENVSIKMTDDKNLQSLIVIDGKITDYKGEVTIKRDDLATGKVLRGKEATDKYGEKGKYGVIEIITKTGAIASGMKIPTPPQIKQPDPGDYPTFQGQNVTGFIDWIKTHCEYPEEASANDIEGWVTVFFTVEPDGSISINESGNTGPAILVEEVKRVINSSPKWDPPENPEVDSPLPSSVRVLFQLPDRIIKEEPFVVVEEMPMYPGGEMELLRFIAENTHYPDSAKAQGIEGRVIVRFIVTTAGNTEGISVLKGVHPLLDAEAIRVVSLLSGFKPGIQGGQPVNVWYMVPITFTVNKEAIE